MLLAPGCRHIASHRPALALALLVPLSLFSVSDRSISASVQHTQACYRSSSPRLKRHRTGATEPTTTTVTGDQTTSLAAWPSAQTSDHPGARNRLRSSPAASNSTERWPVHVHGSNHVRKPEQSQITAHSRLRRPSTVRLYLVGLGGNEIRSASGINTAAPFHIGVLSW